MLIPYEHFQVQNYVRVSECIYKFVLLKKYFYKK